MMLTRHNTDFWNHLPLIGPLSPGEHLSNLALCLMLVPVAGLSPVLNRRYRVVWPVIVGTVVLNFVVELWVTVLNTPDLSDACWGTAGVVIGGLVLALIDRWGERTPNAPAIPDGHQRPRDPVGQEGALSARTTVT